MCTVCFVGTDATHAEHIETIKSRMYVGLTADQRFLPGELGMGLVEGVYAHTPLQISVHTDVHSLFLCHCFCYICHMMCV